MCLCSSSLTPVRRLRGTHIYNRRSNATSGFAKKEIPFHTIRKSQFGRAQVGSKLVWHPVDSWILGKSLQPGETCASTYMAIWTNLKSFRNVGYTSGGDSRELSDGQSIGSATPSLGRWMAKLGPDVQSEWLEAQVQRTGNGKQVSTNIGRAPSGSWSGLSSTGRRERYSYLGHRSYQRTRRSLWRGGVERRGQTLPGLRCPPEWGHYEYPCLHFVPR